MNNNYASSYAAFAGYLLFIFAFLAGFATLPGLGFVIGGWIMFLISAVHDVGERILDKLDQRHSNLWK